MQLTPRYGSDPLITLDGRPGGIGPVLARQQQRLIDELSRLDDEQWRHPTRCDGWSVREVILHLDSATGFWSYSITQALQGEPTRFLADFDPVATPLQLVASAADVPPAEVLERFTASARSLAGVLGSLEDADWSTLAEAPPGHVTVEAAAHHALWDSWVHERDVLLPLGLQPAVEPDEVTACLRYAAALSPAFAVTRGRAGRGTLAVVGTDPDVSVVVEVGTGVAVRAGDAPADVELRGDALELLEALSRRRPLDRSVPAEQAWMVDGLAEAFDQVPG